MQSILQPSPSCVFPSSPCSFSSTVPSPQKRSSMQNTLHPSPPSILPSSHSSPAPITPFPQAFTCAPVPAPPAKVHSAEQEGSSSVRYWHVPKNEQSNSLTHGSPSGMPPQVLFPCPSSSQVSEIPQSRSFVHWSSESLLQRLPLSQSSPVCTSQSPHPSSLHVLLQPSLLSPFPSSHSSCGTSRSPLPHTVTTSSSPAGTISPSPSHGERNRRLHPPITRPVVALIWGMEQA